MVCQDRYRRRGIGVSILGNLDKRCRIERKAVTQEADYGTEVVTWALVGAAWCNVQDELPSKSEAVKQGLAVATNRTRWRARFRTDIDSSMRIVISRPSPIAYQIISGPAELGNKDGIECMLERYSS